MNYIWDLLIQARRSQIPLENIQFVPAKVYSPYMELSFEHLNSTTLEQYHVVEINPYYRFHEIFRDLFDVNFTEEEEMRHTLFDLLVHFLAEIDKMQGMNKREYYIQFVLRDIEAGIFGDRVKAHIHLFDQAQQEQIALHILRLYETGEAVYLFKETMRAIFHHPIIYANGADKDELLFYMGMEESEIARTQVAVIQEIFLPVTYRTQIYWNHHFGVMGVTETMRMEGIALY
ncbi:iron-dependent peroxidase [Brevibacillus dissolubilis]|uniref:iron-dependent peroxidase n=1 Tax=Brevibacillus dissolubilis TaxID=1844116 RepID=UPI00159BEB07|nr:iron-dependent peroxidase [Brevibacillus dissolubilis]